MCICISGALLLGVVERGTWVICVIFCGRVIEMHDFILWEEAREMLDIPFQLNEVNMKSQNQGDVF